MAEQTLTTRISGLDALRAITMYMGVILHASIAYKAGYHPRYWIRDHEAESFFFDQLYFWIHSFRMPLFFMLSGFFAALLSLKIGDRAFVVNRFKRIVIPLLVSVVIILPLSVVPFTFSRIYLDQGLSAAQAWAESLKNLKQMFLFQEFKGLQHFWFLLNLLYFYLIFLGLRKAGMRFEKWSSRLGSGWLVLFLIVATYIIQLAYFRDITPSIWTGLFPKNPQLLFYGGYFFTGVFLYYNRQYFAEIARHSTWMLILGTLISIGLTIYMNRFMSDSNLGSDIYMFKALFSIQCVFLGLGTMGLCLKLFNRESVFIRYLSDASYWVYILHLAIVASAQILWIIWGVPVYLRFFLTILVTTFIAYLTYHFLVRYTLVGEYLHGRRSR